ncbi:hypothetical protein [Marinitoga lauensis]|uniref:hypothetical protein n=1 Tax=Marinitoga lauensis TaxID=2201189 RepID=UPI00101379F8|nr:hypothetical protein [Marinitoga lauensis]
MIVYYGLGYISNCQFKNFIDSGINDTFGIDLHTSIFRLNNNVFDNNQYHIRMSNGAFANLSSGTFGTSLTANVKNINNLL